ncbi:hypothetical protein HPP92_015888 [Vanilla planifolia]|uniref:Reverse transcriptase domain-containing protein n=1 Tax=Vanilla planifolia TaxID=51239 RepID=A0A835QP79_VANPL|nr:hypothetical protein HPP92_015888 [Vanilla planifolia]
MVVKVDMEQAYDRVRWDFLLETMKAMRFPVTWCNWISACISGPRYAVLINGARLPWVSARRGLRQGCPLSPFLFVMSMEYLSCMMREYESRQLLGFRPGMHTPRVSHLLFADDVLIFAPASREAACAVRRILRAFEDSAGLKANFSKSNVYFSNSFSKKKSSIISRKLGMAIGDPPVYLGVPYYCAPD